MNKNLEKALGALDEVGIVVDSFGLDRIQEVDNAVDGSLDSLYQMLHDLEHANRTKWFTGLRGLNYEWGGDTYGYFAKADRGLVAASLNPDVLREVIFMRCMRSLAALPGDIDYCVESGGIKTIGRTHEKVGRLSQSLGKEGVNIGDLTRFRIVANGLRDLDALYESLLANYHLKLLGGNNYYARTARRTYGTPWRGVNTVWGGFTPGKVREDGVTTEIQFITRRVREVSVVDHPFNASKIAKYPNEEVREYVRSLMLKASILDFEEAFG